MKKAEKLNELKIGQTVYLDEMGKRQTVIRSIENKLVPYIVASDNSCHCLYRGIWFNETAPDVI